MSQGIHQKHSQVFTRNTYMLDLPPVKILDPPLPLDGMWHVGQNLLLTPTQTPAQHYKDS